MRTSLCWRRPRSFGSNHELLSELIEDGTLTQGLSAYQAAKFLKQQAVEAGEQAAAERIVRTELARRFTQLVAEAKNARYSTAFIFLGASVAVGLVTYAHLRGDAMSAMLSRAAPAPLRFIAPHLDVLSALTAVAFALWAVAYSKPSPEAAAAMAPITRVALVDEDNVELVESDWTRTSDADKRRARRVAPPSIDAAIDERKRSVLLPRNAPPLPTNKSRSGSTFASFRRRLRAPTRWTSRARQARDSPRRRLGDSGARMSTRRLRRSGALATWRSRASAGSFNTPSSTPRG